MRIGIIVGSTRPGRLGSQVGAWVKEQADQRDDADYELVELADQELTLLAEPTVPAAANRQYENPATRAWGRLVDGFDSFVFVVPEYNHGVSAAMKNAFDVIAPEWGNKAVGFVAYGADGGTRAVEQWRTIVNNVHLVPVRAQIALGLFTDFTDGSFTPQDRRAGELATVLDEVTTMGATLEQRRSA